MDLSEDIRSRIQMLARSHSLTLRELMRALCSSRNGDRRNRVCLPEYTREDVMMVQPLSAPRNVISWGNPGSSLVISLSDLITRYVDGLVSTTNFRSTLSKHGVGDCPELRNLIRSHDADNSGTCHAFRTVLMRMGHLQGSAGEEVNGLRMDTKEHEPKSLNPNKARKNFRYVLHFLLFSPSTVRIYYPGHLIRLYLTFELVTYVPREEPHVLALGIRRSGIPSGLRCTSRTQ